MFVSLLRKTMESLKEWINLRVSLEFRFLGLFTPSFHVSKSHDPHGLAVCCHHQRTCMEDRRAASLCESPCSHLKHSVWLARSLVRLPFLHLAVWSMFACHHFWWIHFTRNARLSHGCLKSEAGARTREQRPSPGVSAGLCYPLCARRSTSPRSSLHPHVCRDGNIFDSIKESVSNCDRYQN